VRRGFRAPTEGERLAVKELTEETDKAAAVLNASIGGGVTRIDEAMRRLPRTQVDPVK